MENLKDSLEKFAELNAFGRISDEMLVKASEAYKVKSLDFTDSYDYQVCVIKSLYDHFHGLEQDTEICKAIVAGQTKVVDGVVYIYTRTPNAKTEYDWRVFNSKKKSARQITTENKEIDELFPSDLNDVKVVKNLSGSTGAKLVSDSVGNYFVMKNGKNTSNEHLKIEFLTCQLYNVLGIRTPDYELFEKNGDNYLLSKYITNAGIPTAKDFPQMAKNFVADVLLANWDIYQNDNCLLTTANQVVRVDNGGALNFRARGGKKVFDGDVSKDFNSMSEYNPSVIANLSKEDLILQIDNLIDKKDDVLDFLRLIEEDGFISIFKKRFEGLEKIKEDLKTGNFQKIKKTSNKKTDETIQHDFTDEELDEIWENADGEDFREKMSKSNDVNGWTVLSTICKKRGFDAPPKVVEEEEFWKEAPKSKYQMFRGLSDTLRGNAKNFCSSFKYDEVCYYGQTGVYGQGIYAQVNDSDEDKKSRFRHNYRQTSAFQDARNYANDDENILPIYFDESAKIITIKDLKEEIKGEMQISEKVDKKEIAKKEEKYADKKNEIKIIKNTLDYLLYEDADIKKARLMYNESVLEESQKIIEETNWGKTNKDGEPEYPSFDKFLQNYLSKWVKRNGGTVKEKVEGSGAFVFTLPHSRESFLLSRYQWENDAIKQKNAFTKAYNYPLKRFYDWMIRSHYNVIDKKVEEEMREVNNRVIKYERAVKDGNKELRELKNEIAKMKYPEIKKSKMISELCQNVDGANNKALGVYAAIKGYDGIRIPNGNGLKNSFMVILNRSKLIVKK